MNSLNSVLIEGDLVSVGELIGDETDGAITFFIESKRFYKIDGTPTEEAYRV